MSQGAPAPFAPRGTKSETLTAFVREAVSHKLSLLCTDAYRVYNKLRV